MCPQNRRDSRHKGRKKIKALEQYGELIGIAFNIQDDLLDMVGDEEKLGKKIGRDVKQGKKTLPVIHALANANGEDVDRLKAIDSATSTPP